MIIRFFIRDGCINCFHTEKIYNRIKNKYKNNDEVMVTISREQDNPICFKLYNIKVSPTVIVSSSPHREEKRYEGISAIFKVHENL